MTASDTLAKACVQPQVVWLTAAGEVVIACTMSIRPSAMPNWRELVRRFADARVLVLGDVMLDRYVSGSASRLSPEAPIPVLRPTARRATLGGAANVALNVATLGGHVVADRCDRRRRGRRGTDAPAGRQPVVAASCGRSRAADHREDALHGRRAPVAAAR